MSKLFANVINEVKQLKFGAFQVGGGAYFVHQTSNLNHTHTFFAIIFKLCVVK